VHFKFQGTIGTHITQPFGFAMKVLKSSPPKEALTKRNTLHPKLFQNPRSQLRVSNSSCLDDKNTGCNFYFRRSLVFPRSPVVSNQQDLQVPSLSANPPSARTSSSIAFGFLPPQSLNFLNGPTCVSTAESLCVSLSQRTILI